MSLPFEDESFDIVLCQFGVMFFPDHIKPAFTKGTECHCGGAERNPAPKVV